MKLWKLRNKINKIAAHGGAAIILGASIFGGIKFTDQFRMFDSNYWKQEVVEEKNRRLQILDRINGLGNNGVYSVDDLALLHDGILASTMLFNYMDTGKGKVPAYDNPISPGDPIMGDLNIKYGRRFNTRDVLADLRRAYEAGKPIRLSETDLDERVGQTIGEIRATFTDPTFHQEDLRGAEYRTQAGRVIVGGFGGLLLGLWGYAGLNSLYNRRKS